MTCQTILVFSRIDLYTASGEALTDSIKSFMKMVIDVAVGNEIEVLSNNINNTVEIHFLFTQDDLNKLKNISSNRIYRISNIDFDNLGKTKDSSSRLGYYIELC